MLNRNEELLAWIKKAINDGSDSIKLNHPDLNHSEIAPNLIAILRESSVTHLTLRCSNSELTDQYNGDLTDMRAEDTRFQLLPENSSKPKHLDIHIKESPTCRVVPLMIDLLAANLPCMKEVCIDNDWLMDESELSSLIYAIQKNTTINTLRIFKDGFSLANLKLLLVNKNINTLSWGVQLLEEELDSFRDILLKSHVSALFIFPPDFGFVADMLLTNARLKRLVLAVTETRNTSAQLFARFKYSLMYNSSLEFLKINFNSFSREQHSALIESLRHNKGLKNFILFNGAFYDEQQLELYKMANLHPKLRCRYYYGGCVEPAFIQIFQKNLDYYSMYGRLGSNAIQDISSSLRYVQHPDFMDYISEFRRLSEALKYFSGEELLTRNILENLLLPFTYPKLQAVADLALGLLVATNQEKFEGWDEKGRHHYIFNKLKKALPGSIFENLFHISWSYLQTKSDSLTESVALRNTHVLISYAQIKQMVIQLINQALPKDLPEFKQRLKLQELLNTHSNYHPAFVRILWRSPIFLNALYDQYAGKAVLVIEDYLLLSSRVENINMDEVVERVSNPIQLGDRLQLSEDDTPDLFLEAATEALAKDEGIPEAAFAVHSCKSLLDFVEVLPGELVILAPPEDPQPVQANPSSFFYNPVKRVAEIYQSTGCAIL